MSFFRQKFVIMFPAFMWHRLHHKSEPDAIPSRMPSVYSHATILPHYLMQSNKFFLLDLFCWIVEEMSTHHYMHANTRSH